MYRGEEKFIPHSVGKPVWKTHLEDPGIDGRIILERVLKKYLNGGITMC